MSALRMYLRRDVLDPNGGGKIVQNRFMFIPMESVQITLDNQAIDPELPANNSQTLYGASPTTGVTDGVTNSTTNKNFIVNIGRQRLTLNVEGTFQPLSAADFPPIAFQGGGAQAGNIQGGNLPAAGGGAPLCTKAVNIVYEQSVSGSTLFTSNDGAGTNSPAGSNTDPSAPGAPFALDGGSVWNAQQQRDTFLKWVASQSLRNVYCNWRLGYGNYLSPWDTTPLKFYEFQGQIIGSPTITEVGGGPPNAFKYSFQFVTGNTLEKSQVQANF